MGLKTCFQAARRCNVSTPLPFPGGFFWDLLPKRDFSNNIIFEFRVNQGTCNLVAPRNLLSFLAFFVFSGSFHLQH